jgi:hypothetical protein
LFLIEFLILLLLIVLATNLPFRVGWQVLLVVVAERFGTLWTRLLFAVVALFPFV